MLSPSITFSHSNRSDIPSRSRLIWSYVMGCRLSSWNPNFSCSVPILHPQLHSLISPPQPKKPKKLIPPHPTSHSRHPIAIETPLNQKSGQGSHWSMIEPELKFYPPPPLFRFTPTGQIPDQVLLREGLPAANSIVLLRWTGRYNAQIPPRAPRILTPLTTAQPCSVNQRPAKTSPPGLADDLKVPDSPAICILNRTPRPGSKLGGGSGGDRDGSHLVAGANQAGASVCGIRGAFGNWNGEREEKEKEGPTVECVKGSSWRYDGGHRTVLGAGGCVVIGRLYGWVFIADGWDCRAMTGSYGCYVSWTGSTGSGGAGRTWRASTLL